MTKEKCGSTITTADTTTGNPACIMNAITVTAPALLTHLRLLLQVSNTWQECAQLFACKHSFVLGSMAIKMLARLCVPT